jgi:hypothetical protein
VILRSLYSPRRRGRNFKENAISLTVFPENSPQNPPPGLVFLHDARQIHGQPAAENCRRRLQIRTRVKGHK